MTAVQEVEALVERARKWISWYGEIRMHASRHYDMGWAYFVEGMDVHNFIHSARINNFVSYDAAFHYFSSLAAKQPRL